MKKLRYYAPYWVTALVIIAVVLLVTGLKNREKLSLYDYALTLEDDSFFASYSRDIWRVSHVYENGLIKVKKTDEVFPDNVSTERSTDLNEMQPYDYFFFIRQDGTAWMANEMSSRHITLLEPCIPLDTEIPTEERDILISIEEGGYAKFNISLLNKESESLRSPQCYLYVKLADGNYYRVAQDYDYCAPVGFMERETFSIKLPYQLSDYYTGSYRICIYSNTYTYGRNYNSIPEGASLIATVDFELTKTLAGKYNTYDYKLTNFRSSAKDFTAG